MIQEADTSEWASLIATLSPIPSVVFNAFGTTRAAAGGVQNQWSIDHDLVISTAKAAAQTAAPNSTNTTPGSVPTGVRTFVFISSGGTRGGVSKYMPYSQMKIGVEDTIRDLGFECGIVLRLGMIVGKREKPKSAILETVLGNLHRVSWKVQDLIGMFVLKPLPPSPFFFRFIVYAQGIRVDSVPLITSVFSILPLLLSLTSIEGFRLLILSGSVQAFLSIIVVLHSYAPTFPFPPLFASSPF